MIPGNYGSRLISEKMKYVYFMFENCEQINLSADDVRFICADGIYQQFLKAEESDFPEVFTMCSHARVIIKNTCDKLSTINRNAVVRIDILFEQNDGAIFNSDPYGFYVPWDGEFDNKLQKNTIKDNGDLEMIFEKEG